ncbi:22200_t:CDS:2 [Entrophospora sp. SA101]|nr:13006_t:CDS:2 [Entrophospora sp. SA101]CAJ0634228.1 14888_t:CDS:2 [Entrophospora sp. SA101]CAJ0754201.1 22200_t:CDS:2 [Entrophospora sp. SA101]CAJ0859400.1 10814_t:CDS:2 [Entrophospora sp. SA101]
MYSKYIDVHAHVYPASFPNTPIDQILIRARVANVSSIVCVSETIEDARSILKLKHGDDSKLSASYRQMIEPCAGLHPVDPFGAKSVVKLEQVEPIINFIKEKSFELVGIGEVGLDFTPHVLKNAIKSYPELRLDEESLKKVQRDVLARQIALSLETSLPLNVHSRSAGHYVIDCLKDYGARNVVLHAFDGQVKYAKAGVEMGFYFSIPPSIIRSTNKKKLVEALPLSNLLLETDSPALGPVRGVDNEPNSIVVSAKEIAKIKNLSVEEVTGNCNLDEIKTVENYYYGLLLASDELELLELLKYVEKHILQNGIPWLCENVVKVYSAAYGNQCITELQELCVKLICEKPNILFKSKDFPCTNKLALINIVKKDYLNTNELQVWKSISKSENLEKFKIMKERLEDVLPHIRYFEVTPNDYYNFIRPYQKILSEELRNRLHNHYIVNIHHLPSGTLKKRVPVRSSNIFTNGHFAIIKNWIRRIEGGGGEVGSIRGEVGTGGMGTGREKKIDYKFSRIKSGTNNFDKKYITRNSIDKNLKGSKLFIIKVRNITNDIIGGYFSFSENNNGASNNSDKTSSNNTGSRYRTTSMSAISAATSNPIANKLVKDNNEPFYLSSSKCFIFSFKNNGYDGIYSGVIDKDRAIKINGEQPNSSLIGFSFGNDLNLTQETYKCEDYSKEIVNYKTFLTREYEIFEVLAI